MGTMMITGGWFYAPKSSVVFFLNWCTWEKDLADTDEVHNRARAEEIPKMCVIIYFEDLITLFGL
jgi:hypothetical protein